MWVSVLRKHSFFKISSLFEFFNHMVSSEALAFANFAVGSSHLKASDTEQLELLLLANLPP